MALLVGGFYPLWLLAGITDYGCHRRSDIEATSGTRESWFHVAQFVSLAVPILLASALHFTPLLLALLTTAVLIHTVLAYFDVAYTDSRRYISPLEQHAHGFMSVLPVVALAIVAVLHWDELTTSPWTLHARETPFNTPTTVLLLSFFILAGAPIVEELIRTSRYRKSHRSASTHDAHGPPNPMNRSLSR